MKPLPLIADTLAPIIWKRGNVLLVGRRAGLMSIGSARLRIGLSDAGRMRLKTGIDTPVGHKPKLNASDCPPIVSMG